MARGAEHLAFMNLDRLQLFPNQRIDNNPTECVALTVADVCGNADMVPYSPDFLYAYTLKLMGKEPNTAGLDPYTGMLTPIVYGLLPMTLVDFTAATTGQLYIANWRNSAMEDRIAAQKTSRRGVKSLYSYEAIVNHMTQYQQGVSLAIKWYESFNLTGPDGILPAPRGNFTYHNVAIFDSLDKGLKMKPWLGPNFGDGGYVYLNQSLFNEIFQSAAGFDPFGWRWLQLASIAAVRPWVIPDVLPLLYATR